MTHSFPTRRSSDRQPQRLAAAAFAHRLHRHDRADAEHQPEQGQPGAQAAAPELLDGLAPDRGQGGEQAVHGLSASVVSSLAASTSRSEEHTSELQSLMRISYAGFCLKKKKTKHTNT